MTNEPGPSNQNFENEISAGGRSSLVFHLENRQKCFLRHLNVADGLHTFFAFFLLFQELPFPRDVAAVAPERV